MLATIDIHADIEFDLESARHGNPYTGAAHEFFQKLEFKNMLSRFDVERVTNDVESAFREVTDRQEIDRIFSEAAQAPCVGAAFSRDPGNVLPLFAHPSGYGRIALAWGPEQIVSIPCDMEMNFDELSARVSELAAKVPCFAMCGLKDALKSCRI